MCTMAGIDFCRARIFRRTGRHSYAVHLAGSPGVVEVHCIDEDWGYMTATAGDAGDLEDRLCTVGTRGMFAWDKQAGRMAPLRAQPLELEEGVEVALGPYDPGRRAFVQCRLRVVAGTRAAKVASPARDAPGCAAVEREESVEPSKRRPFKWMVWL